jgi:hypothetical protein
MPADSRDAIGCAALYALSASDVGVFSCCARRGLSKWAYPAQARGVIRCGHRATHVEAALERDLVRRTETSVADGFLA